MEFEITAQDNEIDELFANQQVALSNALIQAREKTSLLESKIELLAIYRMGDEMKTLEKTDAKGKKFYVNYVEISSGEIRKLIGRKGGSLYAQIEAAALELKKKIYIYRDKGSEQFAMKSLYGDVSYKDGKLKVEFNPDTEYLFLELKDNFTRIKLDIAFKFQTNGGFQLYKLLKSYAYTLPEIDLDLEQEELPVLQKMYNLSELRLQLGYVDLNQPDLRKEGSKKNPDPDKLAEMEKKPKYKRWSDFYNRVIAPGIEEVNRISDIYIASVDKECIAHGKVSGVSLKIQHNRSYYLKNMAQNKPQTVKGKVKSYAISEDELDDLIDDIRDLINEPLKTRDCKAIAEAAEYDFEKIKKAYSLAEKSSADIQSITGFIISALKNDWESTEKKGNIKGFGNFDQRDDIDYNKLAEEIRKNQKPL